MPEGYRLFYLKRDLSITDDRKIPGLPLTLTSIIIPPELKESAEWFIEESGSKILTEEQVKLWCDANGLDVGQ